MTAKILDGKNLANELKLSIKTTIDNHRALGKRAPGLAVILIGQDPASILYVRKKQLACEEVGIVSTCYHLDSNVSEHALIELIQKLNQEKNIDGILVQLPLPSHINESKIVEAVHPNKDIDGFHPYNMGRLAEGNPLFRPCTPKGIMLLLETINIPLSGINALVIGVSNIVGRPMILELLMAGATVTACHRQTKDLSLHLKEADLIIVATGNPNLIKANFIKSGAIVIDVGMNRLDNNSYVGDVDFSEVSKKASFITPVPGGVGPMTVACLLQNSLLAYNLFSEQFECGTI